MHTIKFYSLLFVIGITFFSCSKENFEAEIPAYISISKITLTTNNGTEGSNSSSIVDAWVFVNDDLIGAFELPAKFPILKEGNAKLEIFAGIKNNGIAADRQRYLLYSSYTEQVNFVKGETMEIIPNLTYNSSAKFSWIEDFEQASLSFLFDVDSDTIINKQSLTVKEGAFSGEVFLETGMDFFETTSLPLTDIPRNGSPVYLELDFITNEPILIGVYIDNDQFGLVTLNTANDWKKIYINLTEVINNSAPADEIKVFFGTQATTSSPFISSNPNFYFDNIKLVHF